MKIKTKNAKNGVTSTVNLAFHKDLILKTINQSINQSINVFQGKIQTAQFTNIYKHTLFLHDIHMILVIMKTN